MGAEVDCAESEYIKFLNIYIILKKQQKQKNHYN